MAARGIRVVLVHYLPWLYYADPASHNCHTIVKNCQQSLRKLDTIIPYKLAAECPSSETKRFGPEGARGIRELHDAPNSRNESIHLFFFNHQRRSHFQDHEIIPADLGQESEIPKQSHHQDLPEHSAVYSSERLVRNSQSKLLRCLKFDSHQQSQTANFFHHLKFPQRARQLHTQILACLNRAPS